jgi:hypothetical protein
MKALNQQRETGGGTTAQINGFWCRQVIDNAMVLKHCDTAICFELSFILKIEYG